MKSRILFYLIIGLFVFFVGFIVYKWISIELKKSLKNQEKIINECKTEEERINSLKRLKKHNIRKAVLIYLSILIVLTMICFAFLFIVRIVPHSQIKPIGSYEIFKINGISYYGKHNYSIFCDNNGTLAFSTYKIFDKKNKTVFETNSYEKFLAELEAVFKNNNIEKINFYGTCLSDSGYKSLGYAINNSNLIESHNIEEFIEGQLIHIKTINGVLINIEYLWDDMICTCKGA